MKKFELISSIIATSTIFGSFIAPLSSCKSNTPEIEKEIKLTYNDGLIEDVVFTDKSQPIVFEIDSGYEGKVIIKSVHNNIATINENNVLVPKYLGTTEIYAYLEEDPKIKSNSINVTIQATEDTLTISDSQVLSSSEIIDNPIGESVAVITGFKADFSVNTPNNGTLHMVVPSINWGESQDTFEGAVSLVNLQTDIFGKTTFDVKISTLSDLTKDTYQFVLDFTIDSTEKVQSKTLTLTKTTKAYYIHDSQDEAKFTDNWKKICLTKFLTNIDIVSGIVTLTAGINGDLFEHNPPKYVNITNKKYLAGETYQFDVEIVWDTYATLDTDDSFAIQFYINNVPVSLSKQYEIAKIKQATSAVYKNAVYIIDGEKPCAIVSFETNFAFTNELDTKPVVKAEWTQPKIAEVMTAPSSTEIIDIVTTGESTTFNVKFTWDERFADSFHYTYFAVNLTADDKPILCNEVFEIIWHYGIRYEGKGSTTLIKDEDESFATISKFVAPDKTLKLNIEDIEFADFTWESTSSLANPTKIEAYNIERESDFAFGVKLHWQQGFNITEDTYCCMDIIYQNEIIVNDFRFLVKKQSETSYWDLSFEEKNASLNVILNTQDLIQVSVTDIAPNSTLVAYYLKISDSIQYNNPEAPHIIYEDDVISIIPGLTDAQKSDPLIVGIEYNTASDTMYDLNIPSKDEELGATVLSSPGKVDIVKDRPIYIKIDFGALIGIYEETYEIQAGIFFAGSLEGSDYTKWELCNIDLTKSYCSFDGACGLVESFYVLAGTIIFCGAPISILKDLNVILKIHPEQTFDDADMKIIFGK